MVCGFGDAMIEVRGNLWTFPADVRVITTNGAIRRDGRCVMGRGCALQATERYPLIAKLLGDKIRHVGNIVHILRQPVTSTDTVVGNGVTEWLVSFPVKHHWREKAGPALIEVSARTLAAFADLEGWKAVVMPRPGCGNGHLNWTDVKPLLEPILDDRFHVITY